MPAVHHLFLLNTFKTEERTIASHGELLYYSHLILPHMTSLIIYTGNLNCRTILPLKNDYTRMTRKETIFAIKMINHEKYAKNVQGFS